MLEYNYDLISGNVNSVSYQRGQLDAWHHAYKYDGDNRIKAVYSSKHPDPMSIAGVTNPDPVAVEALWDNDAKYFYYDHGPLARVELGDMQVQGIDYAYTLQGWLKGVNSNELDPTKDMGHDGATGPNQNVAADAFSFSLHYNAGDYQSIGGATAQQWLKDMAGTALEADRKDLWNGNIGMMLTNISLPTGLTPGANDRPGLLGNVYAYDQLNRLKEARSDWNNAGGFGATYQTTDMYLNTFNYDANGNILKQLRKDQLASTIDDLRYTYKGAVDANGMITSSMNSNRLYSVYDQLGASTFDDDIDAEDMTGATYDYQTNTTGIESNGNYQYTKIGELKSDEQEQIEEIVWRVDSKISEVRRTSGSSKKTLRFGYDAMGNRTAKYVYNDAAMTQLHSSTYYVHDATGNVMAVYEKLEVATNARSTNFALIERHIFGSSRLGMDNSPVEYLSENPAGRAPYSSSDMLLMRILSQKQYELSNHLGNVLVTISDRKLYSVIFSAEVVTSSDYSPFGVTLDGREFRANYRYGFQNQEGDKELWEGAVTYKYRIEDPRLGRFFSVDPLSAKYPHNSCYAFSENMVIHMVELEGLEAAKPAAKDGSVESKDSNTNYAPSDEALEKRYGKQPQAKLINSIIAKNAAKAEQEQKKVVSEKTRKVMEVLHPVPLNPSGEGSGDKLSDPDAERRETAFRMFDDSPIGTFARGVDGKLELRDAVIVGSSLVPMLKIKVPSVGRIASGVGTQAEVQVANECIQAEKGIFLVTKEGVALPKGGIIPNELICSRFSSPRSSVYGIMENGKFVEKLRIDPARFANPSHFHINGKGTKLTNWRWF